MAAAAAVGYYDLCRGCPIERNGAKLDHRHDDESADDAVKLGNHAWEPGGGEGAGLLLGGGARKCGGSIYSRESQ